MKAFLQRIKNKVIELFKKLTATIKAIIPVGIKIVNAIKRITDSDVADVFVTITAHTDLDNKILSFIRKTLPKVLKELEEWDDAINGTEEEILKNSLIKINNYSKPKRNLLYLGIASGLNKELAGDGLSDAEALTATHEAYNHPELLNS